MWGLLAAIALVALNGFFVAAEYSMVRVRPGRLERLQRQGDARAVTAAKVVANLESYLSASQIGITLASLALGWIGEPAIAHLVYRAYESVFGREIGGSARAVAIAISFIAITFFHVLLGEQVPKLLALYRAENMALALAGPFRFAYTLLAPVRFFLEGSTNLVLPMFGVSKGRHAEQKVTEEELLSIIAATLARGPAAEDKRKLLERVIRFASRQARHAMIPRVDVAYLPIETKGDEAIVYLRKERYSRLLLTEGDDLDRVVGYLYAKDLILDPNVSQLRDLRGVRRDVLYAPEPQSLIDVLRAMQSEKTLLAVVVDEYGGTSGILTMEDLLEEIVGDIRDETDEEPVPSIREALGVEGAIDVEADTPLDELRGLHIEPPDGEGGESLGAYVVRHVARVPRRGDRVRMGGWDVEIRAMRRRRVVTLRLYPRVPSTSISPVPAVPPGESEP
jgi:CBS domain containing-hemolysin-like protein